MGTNKYNVSAQTIQAVRAGLNCLTIGFIIFGIAALVDGQLLMVVAAAFCAFGSHKIKRRHND